LRQRGRTGIALAITAAFALVGAGCTGGGGGHGGDATASAKVRQQAAKVQVNAVSYDDVKAGGVLNYPLHAPITNFNRYQLDGDNVDTIAVMGTSLPSLFTIDGANRFTANPDYLTGEPAVATSPAQSITYSINPKATWSDGTPISYKDFVSQWQALNGTNPNYTITTSAGYADVASVARGATDQKVVVTFKTGVVDPDWRALFSPLYPMSATQSAAAFNGSWETRPGVSGGPFMFQSADPATKSYTFVANPHWWGRKPKLSKIVFKAYPSATAMVSALRAHQIDVQDVGFDLPTYQQVKAVSGVSVRTIGGPDSRALTINGSRGPLTDVKIRQALAMGIDRDAIARAELAPFGIGDAAAPDDHVFLANQDGYKDNAGTLGSYNPTAAGQALDAAGWTLNPTTHVREKGGKPLALSFVIPADTANSTTEAQLIKQQLGKIGVKVTIKPVNATKLFNDYVVPGDYDLTVFSWLGSNFPITSASTIYEPEQPGDNWQQNYSRVSVPQLNTLFKQALASLDTAAATAAANQADSLIWQNVLSLPLYQRPDVWAVNSKLANIGAFGFATIDWTSVGFTS